MRQRPPGRAPAGPGAKNGRVARGHKKTRGRLGRAEACATPDKLVAQVVGQARRVVREVSELQDMMDRAAVSRCHGWFLSHVARIFFPPLRRRRSTATAAAAAAPAAAAHCAVCLGKRCVVLHRRLPARPRQAQLAVSAHADLLAFQTSSPSHTSPPPRLWPPRWVQPTPCVSRPRSDGTRYLLDGKLTVY